MWGCLQSGSVKGCGLSQVREDGVLKVLAGPQEAFLPAPARAAAADLPRHDLTPPRLPGGGRGVAAAGTSSALATNSSAPGTEDVPVLPPAEGLTGGPSEVAAEDGGATSDGEAPLTKSRRKRACPPFFATKFLV
jgi:hypothetical protein